MAEALKAQLVEVHLHRLTGDLSKHDCLSDSERAKADAFRFASDRARYVESHIRLRHQLSRYLDQPPQSIAIAADAHGKPRIPGDPIHFNISHAGSFYAAAFCRDDQVGVDVEVSQKPGVFTELASHICHPAERARLDALPALATREDLLLFYWTAKEAFLKALGVGLQIEPPLVHVLGDPSEGQGSFECADPSIHTSTLSWRLMDNSPTHKLSLVTSTATATVEFHSL